MSCPHSTASTESAAICLRASGCRWVAACPAREDAAVAPRPPFQPITRLWQFEGLSVKHGHLFEPYPPKAKVTRSNRVGCAIFPLFYRAICALGLRLQLCLIRASKQSGRKSSPSADCLETHDVGRKLASLRTAIVKAA